MSIESHGSDGTLMTHDNGLDPLVSEGSHLDVTFLSVRDGQHAGAFAVKGAETVRVIARVQAVDQSQICKVVHICLNGKYNHHANKAIAIS